jgi:hypothetical protein
MLRRHRRKRVLCQDLHRHVPALALHVSTYFNSTSLLPTAGSVSSLINLLTHVLSEQELFGSQPAIVHQSNYVVVTKYTEKDTLDGYHILTELTSTASHIC